MKEDDIRLHKLQWTSVIRPWFRPWLTFNGFNLNVFVDTGSDLFLAPFRVGHGHSLRYKVNAFSNVLVTSDPVI